MTEKAWGGRFSEKTAAIVERFTASIDVDKRLYAYDIMGSIAHVKMLAKTGIITAGEAEAIVGGLEKIKKDIEADHFEFDPRLEDIHMHIEDRLSKEVGEVAKKLHTARSRNDQVALDIRLYMRDAVRTMLKKIGRLRKVFVTLADRYMGVILPGYTHLQRAQPVLFSHYVMAYYDMFTRDARRFEDGLKRIDVLPLGSAALAGTSFPIDRGFTASLLNFPEVSGNSLDAVSDRDFVLEFISAASICMLHLSRLSEELILWSSQEFDFIELPDAFTTGSSIMPQKKNPDVSELVRGKSSRVIGNLTHMIVLMKSLPLSYNRDMQEDKQPLFDTVDTLNDCIDVTCEMLPLIRLKKENMYAAAKHGYLNATDLADYLAEKGIPFREAHRIAGNAVVYAVGRKKELDALSLEELKQFSPVIESDIFHALTPEQMVEKRISFGGTSSQNVRQAIEDAVVQMENEEFI
ncbi:MAG: argininosuccinate lyase [Desulfobacterales bacterium]